MSDGECVKAQAYLAELLAAITLASGQMKGGKSRLKFIEFGYEAKNCIDLVIRSIKNKGIKVERVSIHNPVYISRSFQNRAEIIRGPNVLDLSAKDQRNEGTSTLPADSILYNTSHFHLYGSDELALIAPPRSMKQLRHIRTKDTLNWIAQEFDVIMSKKFRSTGFDKKSDEEFGSYIQSVYETMSTLVKEANQRVTSACEKIEKAADKVIESDAPTSEELKTLVGDARNLHAGLMRWAGVYYGAFSDLSGKVSAVEAVSSVITPLVITKLREVPADGGDESLVEKAVNEPRPRPVITIPPSLMTSNPKNQVPAVDTPVTSTATRTQDIGEEREKEEEEEKVQGGETPRVRTVTAATYAEPPDDFFFEDDDDDFNQVSFSFAMGGSRVPKPSDLSGELASIRRRRIVVPPSLRARQNNGNTTSSNSTPRSTLTSSRSVSSVDPRDVRPKRIISIPQSLRKP
ncbi:hypothetical protein KEM54_002638 [Ascosphaera aggregata]|nr:hypothetical protein KEM54_002638 [Ascosphaera aggregata]